MYLLSVLAPSSRLLACMSQQVEQAFRFFDRDGGGQIEKNGARSLTADRTSQRSAKWHILRVCVRIPSGILTSRSMKHRSVFPRSLSFSEFKAMMLELGDPLTEAEIEEFFAAVDQDNDGHMSYEEFVGARGGGARRCA